MTVDFWGVRGTIPSPGPATVRYGGNTPCVSVAVDDERILVLDAGTGIRRLGQRLAATAHEIVIAITHRHWDHIEGFPFFGPIYERQRAIHLLPVPTVDDDWTLLRLIDGVHSAVDRDVLKARFSHGEGGLLQRLADGGVHLSMIPTNHPGGAAAFRVESRGRTVVYMTDNELDPPYEPTTSYGDFVDFCSGADLLIHDATYLDEEIGARRGWGHSTVEQACRLGADARVRRLALFHHEPDRSDVELDAIGERARAALAPDGVEAIVAREGLTIML